MILVDTSVIVDFLKGNENSKTEIFESILKRNMPYGIASYTVQEVLQGAKDDDEYEKLKDYLSTLSIYFLPESFETYEEAARLFFELRRQGITIRNSIDVLISLIVIKNDLYLLHNDRDFDLFASKIKGLKTMESLV